MSERGPHDLVAAYALDALDADEARAFEQHLGECPACREEVERLRDVAAMLGTAATGPEPPAGLRAAVVERVRLERQAAEPRPRREPRRFAGLRLVPALATATAVFATATIALGTWLALELGDDTPAVLADPAARVVSLEGATGRLVVGPEGEAALVVSGLPPLPDDRVYELWVIDGEPRRAGLFRPSEGATVVELDRDVPEGATVAVTVEPAGGVDRPTGEPILTAQA